MNKGKFVRDFFRGFDLKKYQSAISLLLFLLLFSVMNRPQFLNLDNLIFLLYRSIFPALMTAGLAIVLTMGAIDLSIGAVAMVSGLIGAGIGGTFCGPTMGIRLGPLGLIGGGLAVGLFIGLVNGLVHTKLRIPSFVTTLGIMLMLQGFALQYTTGMQVMLDLDIAWIGSGAALFCIAGGGFLLRYVLLVHTSFGKNSIAIGDNEEVAIKLGIPSNRMKLYGFLLCGGFAGLSGMLKTAYTTIVSPRSGTLDDLLTALIVIFLAGGDLNGGTSIPLSRILSASLALVVLENGLLLNGITSIQRPIILGLILLFVLGLAAKGLQTGVIVK